MTSYYLNDNPIQGPLQIDGLTLKKMRNRRYWGFLYRKLGYVDGLSNLRFEEPDVVTLLNSQLERYGVQAETTFRMERNGEILYDGFIDYTTYTEDRDGVNVSLRDDRAVVDLETQAATVFAIDSSETLSLHARRIGGLATLVTDPNLLTIQRTESYAVALSHSVPLTRRVENDETVAGSPAPVITPLASDPCYYNTTQKDQLVHVTGFVGVTVTTNSANTIHLRVAQVGSTVQSVIGTWSVSTTSQTIAIAVDAYITIQVGQAMKLDWTAEGNNNHWSFVYDAKTSISLADEPNAAASIGKGLFVKTLFASLVSRASGGRLTFRSNFLDTDPDGRLFLANGAGIRGINKSISTSIQALFESLSANFCLSMWVEGTTVRLERRHNRPRTVSTMTAIVTRSSPIATEYLYNSVKAGYATWQAKDSALSADEPNGQRTYSTGITVIRNELNLMSEFITASNLIEQQRRRQFDEKTASEAKADENDDKLFLIAAIAAQAETLQRTDSISGVYDPVTVYNVRLAPGRNVSRWREWLSSSLPLKSESVQGADTMVSTYEQVAVAESSPLAGVRATGVPKLVTISAPCSMLEYSQLGDWIEYAYDGKWITGELLEADWRLADTGETVTLQLLER